MNTPDPGRALSRLSLSFAIYARFVRYETLDIGCGDGPAAAAALERGGYVLAVDSDPRMLERLQERIPPPHRARLRVQRGALPQIEFPPQSFAAIHASHALSRLEHAAVEQSLGKMLIWLQPGGKLFASLWLGEIPVRRVLAAAGFILEEIETYPDADVPGKVCCAIIARRGER